MPRTTPVPERLLGCSPERTVLATVDPTTGRNLVVKWFVRGALADAEREVAIGRHLAHLEVAVYHTAGLDPVTRRPQLIADLLPGQDLAALVASRGALPTAEAARLLAAVARTLAAMHNLTDASHPHGLCHGDVKPQNLLVDDHRVRLLDFEHACAVATMPRQGAFAGTPGFAAPELQRGSGPSPAADVHALGATLRWALDGGLPRGRPRFPGLAPLLDACTNADPARRPAPAAVAEQLDTIAARAAADPAEAAIAALAHGDLRAAHQALAGTPADHALRAAVQRQLLRVERILRHCPGCLQPPEALPTEPAVLHRELVRATRLLARLPQHPALLDWLGRLRRGVGRLLAGAGEHLAAARRHEDFAAAAQWLAEAKALCHATRALPGGIAWPALDDPRTIGLLHRDPAAFFAHQASELQAAQLDLQAAAATVDAAECRLDLAGAEAAIERMAATFGGASPTVARRRDLLHRLAFYLQRIGRAAGNLEHLANAWDATALAPLSAFVTACLGLAPRPDGTHTAVGLRSLQVTLANLLEEFAHLAPTAGPALEALGQALDHATDQAWDMLADAQRRLTIVPVPVRPLQLLLGRLDTFRIVEAYVDRPGRPRAQLSDGLESLRVALEQARATRDRLTHGAEQAIAKGHWTTGLFDMERAVAGLDQDAEPDPGEAARLRDRLAEARRRKQEIEAATRRNIDLSARYALLLDDPAATFAARLQTLGERRDCLHFLTVHLPSERGALYARDLREVETLLALEQADRSEQELDGTDDPVVRLRIARETLERLGASSTVTDLGPELPGRLQRLLEHWRTVAAKCQRELDRTHQERAQRQRLRRRALTAVATLAVVALGAIGFAARSWWAPSPALAAGRDGTERAALQQRAAGLQGEASLAATAVIASWPAGSAEDPATWQAFRIQAAAFATTHRDQASQAFAIALLETVDRTAATAAARTAAAQLAADLVGAGLPVPPAIGR